MAPVDEIVKSMFGDLVVEITGNPQINVRLDGLSICPDEGADEDGVVLKFINGAEVRFRTSEWAWIEPVSPPVS